MDKPFEKILRSSKTVFTSKELAIIWNETDRNKLKSKIHYYVKTGNLLALYRGIYAKTKDYDPKELATGIYSPSYISFETVFRETGMIFQHYETIFVAGPWRKEIKIGKYNFSFRHLKKSILYNPRGILNKNNLSIATPERAFLDMLYLVPNYYFDNLNSLNWEKCFEIAEIYQNKELIIRLKKYQKKYA